MRVLSEFYHFSMRKGLFVTVLGIFVLYLGEMFCVSPIGFSFLGTAWAQTENEPQANGESALLPHMPSELEAPFLEAVFSWSPTNDRSLLKERIKAIPSKVLDKADTIFLLITLGVSEKVGERISKYLETGESLYLKEVMETISEISSSTALSSELWAQIMGSQLVHGVQNASVSLGDQALGHFFKKTISVPITFQRVEQATGRVVNIKVPSNILAETLRTQAILRHALGYVGFFGWEFGRELYRQALEDFSAYLKQSGSLVKFDTDKFRAQDIWELVSNSELHLEFLTSLAYVLHNHENLKRAVEVACFKWVFWDLYGTYVSMGLGARAAHVGARTAIALVYGRAVAAEMGAVVLGSRLGRVGGFVGKILGIIFWTHIKELEPVKRSLFYLQGETILKPKKWVFQKQAENAFTGIRLPEFGAGFIETISNVLGLTTPTKNLVHLKDRFTTYQKRRETVISDYLELLVPSILAMNEALDKYMAYPPSELKFLSDFSWEVEEEESSNFLTNAALEKAFKKYKLMAQGIKFWNERLEESKQGDFDRGPELEILRRQWDENGWEALYREFLPYQGRYGRSGALFNMDPHQQEEIEKMLKVASRISKLEKEGTPTASPPAASSQAEQRPSRWSERKKELIDEAFHDFDKEDIKQNMTVKRYQIYLERQMARLQEAYPILTRMQDGGKHHPDDVMHLWEWLTSDTMGSLDQKEVLYILLLKEVETLSKLEEKFVLMNSFLFDKKAEIKTVEARDKDIHHWNHVLGEKLANDLRTFNLRKCNLYEYLQELVHEADQSIEDKLWLGYPQEERAEVERLLKENQQTIHAIRSAIEDLLAWDEYEYEFFDEKMTFLLKWATEGVDDKLFLEKYEKFRSEIDRQIRQEALELALMELQAQWMEEQNNFYGPETLKAMLKDPDELEALHEDARRYLKEHLEAKVQEILKR
ncbi:MAG: hypothetical protein HY390_07830 [Deltaproteobacteria bacterium]|nr:hypothetical protein [Deltaproteobacteria bacterium]